MKSAELIIRPNLAQQWRHFTVTTEQTEKYAKHSTPVVIQSSHWHFHTLPYLPTAHVISLGIFINE